MLGVKTRGFHHDVASWGREFQRIAKQIEQDVVHSRLVEVHVQRGVGRVVLYMYFLAIEEDAHGFNLGAHEICQATIAQMQLHHASFQFAKR